MAASQPANFNLQEFTDAGQLLVGGRLYTYAYGTTTQKTAYTDPDGTVPHTYTADGQGGQYIALNARGELPAPLYLAAGSYDLALKRADGSTVWTRKADGVENTINSWIASLFTLIGSSLVGFIQAGTNAVKRTVQDKLRELVSTADYATLTDAINAVNEGGTVYVEGAVQVNAPLVITKRVNLICRGYDDYLLVNVGAANNAITFQGTAAGLNGIELKLNVYGQAGVCNNAVVLSRVDRSSIDLNVRAGAAAYAVVLDGCLINRINIESSVNYAPPIVSPGTQLDHVLIQKNTTYNIATNANHIRVNLEGARNGIVATAQPNEGMNWYSGCIEGLSGRPLNITNNANVDIDDMWIEANQTKSLFTDCKTPHIGAGVNYINQGDAAGTLNEIDFVNCRGVEIDGMAHGGANFDANCTVPVVRQASTAYDGKYVGEGRGNSAETVGPVIASDTTANPNLMYGGFGESTQENLFHNPFIDIWSLGAATNPDGLVAVNATPSQVTTPLYPRHGSRFSAKCVVTTAGSGNGFHIVPRAPYATYTEDRWIGLAIAVYVASGQPDLRVFAIGGTLLATVTAKDQWVVVRASCKVTSGTALEFWVSCYNTATTTYVTGEYYIGAINIVNGSRVPKYFGDHGKRSEYIVTSIGSTPAFVGQRAYLSGTQKWYFAGGTTSSADWQLLN